MSLRSIRADRQARPEKSARSGSGIERIADCIRGFRVTRAGELRTRPRLVARERRQRRSIGYTMIAQRKETQDDFRLPLCIASLATRFLLSHEVKQRVIALRSVCLNLAEG
jgi:hypothetical protein